MLYVWSVLSVVFQKEVVRFEGGSRPHSPDPLGLIFRRYSLHVRSNLAHFCEELHEKAPNAICFVMPLIAGLIVSQWSSKMSEGRT